jgi:prevent-host-death family protein
MEQSRSPVKTINAMKARQNFGQMLEEVYYRGDQFLIERAGKPMAAVIPLSQLEELQKLHGRATTGSDTIKERTRRSHKGRA